MGKGVRHRQILNTHIKTHISVPTSLKVSLCQITLVLHVFWNTLIDICGVIFLCNLTSSIDLNPWVKDSDAKSAGKLIDPVLKTERDRHRTKYILIYCIFSTAFLTVPAWTDTVCTLLQYINSTFMFVLQFIAHGALRHVQNIPNVVHHLLCPLIWSVIICFYLIIIQLVVGFNSEKNGLKSVCGCCFRCQHTP